MPKGVLIVPSGPSDPSREDEYNEWYDNTHIREVRDVPGVVSTRRFTLSAVQRNALDESTPRYLAIYELDADDLQSVADEIGKRLSSGVIHMTDAFHVDPRYPAMYFEQRDA